MGLVDAEMLDSVRSLRGALLGLESGRPGPDAQNQLHLLQAAFRSLNNFFSLSRASQFSSKNDGDAAPAGTGADRSPSELQQLAMAVQRREVGGPLQSNESFITASVSSVNARLLSRGSGTSLATTGAAGNLKQSLHGAGASRTESAAVASAAAAEAAEVKSGFEFELVQRLFEAQEELRRTRARMEILEMVQEEAMMESASRSLDAFVDEVDDNAPINRRASDAGAFDAGASGEIFENAALFSDGGGWLSAPPVMSFDGIMSELRSLRTCISERATCDYPLGYFLEAQTAVLPVPAVDESGRGESPAPPSAAVEGDDAEDDAASEESSQQPSLAAQAGRDASASGVVHTLSSMRKLSKQLYSLSSRKAKLNVSDEQLLSTIRGQQESLAECKALLELSELDRSEFVAMNVELQMLREKCQRLQKELTQSRSSQSLQREEHSRLVAELEATLTDLRQRQQMQQMPQRRSAGGSVDGAGSGLASASGERNIDVDKYRLEETEHQKDLQSAEIERLRKENQRLKSAIAVSDQRLKGTLQDQVLLQHQVQQMEEETMNAKATITMLTREVDEFKLSKDFREGADRTISELRREVHKRDVELAEAREEAVLAGKYLAELQQAEKTIEDLESNISDVTIELEKGAVAIHQLDNYREQLRVKMREMRDMALHIHSLEAELKDMMYLQNRYAEITEELEEYRMKCEKLPALLSEQARLRGSSRASVKALNEQDKALNHLKGAMKELQRECAMLRNENRAMQELEVKLKEANQEIQRLMTKISDANRPAAGAASAGAQSAHEEKKSIEGQYKKMRKFIRQPTAANGLPSTYA